MAATHTAVKDKNLHMIMFSIVFQYLQTVVPVRSPDHVPLAAGLLWDSVAGVTAEATADLIVGVLYQVFREVTGTLAACDHGDHPGFCCCRLSRGVCERPWDRQVS